MPYAGRMEGYSHIHLYQSVGGGIVCNKCLLDLHKQSKRMFSYEEVLEHMDMHLAAGHLIPDAVISKLQYEMNNNQIPAGMTIYKLKPAPEEEPPPPVVDLRCPDLNCTISTIHTGPHEYGDFM